MLIIPLIVQISGIRDDQPKLICNNRLTTKKLYHETIYILLKKCFNNQVTSLDILFHSLFISNSELVLKCSFTHDRTSNPYCPILKKNTRKIISISKLTVFNSVTFSMGFHGYRFRHAIKPDDELHRINVYPSGIKLAAGKVISKRLL